MKKLLLSLSLIAAVGATAFAGPPGWRNGKTVDVQGRSQQGPPGWLMKSSTDAVKEIQPVTSARLNKNVPWPAW